MQSSFIVFVWYARFCYQVFPFFAPAAAALGVERGARPLHCLLAQPHLLLEGVARRVFGGGPADAGPLVPPFAVSVRVVPRRNSLERPPSFLRGDNCRRCGVCVIERVHEY